MIQLIQILSVSFLLGMLLSCGGSKSKRDKNDDTAVRLGSSIFATDLKSFNANPDLSANGQKFAFISGRSGALRAYLYQDGQGTKITRVTDDATSVQHERDIVLSPDGNWVLFIGTTGTASDLYARDFSRQRSVTRLSLDGNSAIKSAISFDSLKFALVARNLSSGNTEIFVGDIDPVTGPLANSLKLVSNPDLNASLPTWRAAGIGNAQLLYFTQQNADRSELSLWSYDASNASSGATSVALPSPITLGNQSSLLVVDSAVYFSSQNGDPITWNPVSPFGANELSTEVNVENSLVALSKGIFVNLNITKAAPVTFVKSLSTSTQGVIAWTGVVPVGCGESKQISYLNLPYIRKSSESITPLLMKYSTKSKEVSLTDTPCLSESELKAGEVIDGKVFSAKISSDSTDSQITMAYVSTVSGKPRIYKYQLAANGTASVTMISGNE